MKQIRVTSHQYKIISKMLNGYSLVQSLKGDEKIWFEKDGMFYGSVNRSCVGALQKLGILKHVYQYPQSYFQLVNSRLNRIVIFDRKSYREKGGV